MMLKRFKPTQQDYYKGYYKRLLPKVLSSLAEMLE